MIFQEHKVYAVILSVKEPEFNMTKLVAVVSWLF